jgi:tetrapyrrole methylase family protein / MazG family protein
VPRRRPHVTVVGLGPAGSDLLGNDATDQLTRAATQGRAYLRTARHPAAALFEGVPAFDDLYEAAATFDQVYAGIVDVLVAAALGAAPDPIVYAVPGSPLVAERSVDLLRADGRVEVTALPGLSFLDLAWVALAIDPLAAGVRLVDAGAAGPVVGREGGPFLVAQCWSRHLLSVVKLAVPDDDGLELPRPVLLHHLGLEDQVVAAVDWWELDRTLEPDHLTSVYIPAFVPGAGRAAGDEVTQLVALMDTLRERCPWDSVQTHASLMPHLVEESYEVLDALAGLAAADANDDAYAHLEEELGDLLFQIVFHARLADEAGQFDLADVARRVHDKLVHRHPHVFGGVDAGTADEVVTNWEAIKKSEKGRTSVTEGIPATLPALMLTTKLARKARAVGLEPDDARAGQAALALAALTRRAEGTDPHADDPLLGDGEDQQTQMGELLFVVANLAQRLGVDAEQALRDRALSLRADILAAEGVPEDQVGSR